MKIELGSFLYTVRCFRSGDETPARGMVHEIREMRPRKQGPLFFDLLGWTLALGELDLARCFVNEGADINASDEQGNLLVEVFVDDANVAACHFLVENGASATKGLLRAVLNWDIELMDLFLATGADVQSVCSMDLSWFRIHADVLRRLVRAGGKLTEDTLALLEAGTALGDGPNDPPPRSGR